MRLAILFLFVASCGDLCCNCPPTPQEPKACATPAGGSNTGDMFEPNDTLPMAAAPAAHTKDCGLTSHDAVISGGTDTDVFRTGACDTSSGGDPYAELGSGADAGLRLCLFLACDTGETYVEDCYQTNGGDGAANNVLPSRTDEGFRGCCRTGAGRATARVQCSGEPFANHKVEGFIWIDYNDVTSTSSYSYTVSYQM